MNSGRLWFGFRGADRDPRWAVANDALGSATRLVPGGAVVAGETARVSTRPTGSGFVGRIVIRVGRDEQPLSRCSDQFPHGIDKLSGLLNGFCSLFEADIGVRVIRQHAGMLQSSQNLP